MKKIVGLLVIIGLLYVTTYWASADTISFCDRKNENSSWTISINHPTEAISLNVIGEKAVVPATQTDLPATSTDLPPAKPTDGICGDNLTWSFDNGTLNISGTGAMYDYNGEDMPPWYDYCDEITSVVIEDGVTNIGEFAFYYFYENLESVTMADSVTQIGYRAFQYCGALTNLKLSSGLTEIGSYAFAQDAFLTTVTLPDGLEMLGTAVFAESGLTSIVIPAGVATKTWDFFYTGKDGGLHLYHIALPASVKDTGYGTFCYTPLPHDNPDFILSSELTTIDLEAFNNTNARFVWLPEKVKAIGEDAFTECSNLKYVYIPYGCKTIAPNAFPEGTKILGISGYEEPSTAQAYADTYGYQFVELEDPFGGNG